MRRRDFTMGVEPLFVELARSDQLEPAFADMMQKGPDALSMTADPFYLSHVGWIIDFVAKNRLPTMYVVKENAVAGGLISWPKSYRFVSTCCRVCAQDFARY